MIELLQAPAIRTPLQNGDADTTKEWYMFWRASSDQVNRNRIKLDGIVTQGSHADRPDAARMPDGALYIEIDRGVLYVELDDNWQYVAGTMWGTLTPDQRPTDLGVNDGGFTFRGTDQAREYIWSQTEWIEATRAWFGTHAGRPVPAATAEGTLYVETNRGNVIYQNQAGAWKYAAGTMFGTISPDQRPADLGVNDAGFDFRTNVTPPQEYIWSGAAWTDVSGIGGASGLIHSNVVTKVGSAGQIVEGGITDESAAASDRLHITAGGDVGIGTASPAGRLNVEGGRCLISPASETFAVGVRYNTGSPAVWLGGHSGGSLLISNYNGTQLVAIAPGGQISINFLPSTNPGGGSKQLWYDPADGNRVKYQP